MDQTQKINICCIGLILLVGAVLATKMCRGYRDHFNAMQALEQLRQSKQHVQEVSAEELDKIKDQIAIVQHKEGGSSEEMEHFVGGGPINTHYWPYYYYSYPYNVYGGAAWPPGLYSKLYYWYPGFNTSGWSFWVRPGIDVKRWPRSRWVRNQGNYYYINNDQGVKQTKSNSYYF